MKNKIPPNKGPRRPTLPPPKGKTWRTLLIWALLTLAFLYMYKLFTSSRVEETSITYTEFMNLVKGSQVRKVTIVESDIHGELSSPATREVKGKEVEFLKFYVHIPLEDPQLLGRLEERGVEVDAKPKRTPIFSILLQMAPFLIFALLWFFFIRQMQGSQRGVFSFGKSRAKLLMENKPKVTFDDVAGADEAKEELKEVIEFLMSPQKFQRLGGKIPKGVLLLGPPGTGKTLLARAVAGEASVPFFSMSGSDFVEMFVGVGASRVRDLFEQGKRNAPCIIFIDEIDAVGRHRGAGLGGGHDEREQTLNQLLVEMDGFETNEGVILLAATNRPDVLDPALLRPGRFDRQVVVDRPDVRGREGIFRVHTKKIPIAKDVDLSVLARGTPGLSGADLANIVNEAALLAARRDHKKVNMSDFEGAKDKVMMGAERKSMVISEEEKRSIAYHEAGHALVAKLIPGSDPVYKVTIIPRGMALGVTHYLPLDEKHNYSKMYLETKLVHLLGGREAEKLIFGELTTGAGNDIEKATELARKMVCEWGMSEKLGPMTFGGKKEEIFLGRQISQRRDYSEETARLIDAEVKETVKMAEKRARELLKESINLLHRVAEELLEKEIIDGSRLDEILKEAKGEKVGDRDIPPGQGGTKKNRG